MLKCAIRRTAIALVALPLMACHGSSDAQQATRPTTPAIAPAVPTSTVPTTAVPTSMSPTSTSPTSTSPTSTSPTSTSPTSVAPVTAPPAAPFTGTITTVTAADLPSSYRAGCPVGPDSLRMLHMSYWGFDDRAHRGAMVVNAAVTQSVLTVFGTLFRTHFPIREMVPVDAFGGNDDTSMAADNTSAFNCRYVAGTTTWSAHAYGEAIDVNTVQNPYVVNGVVEPPAAAAYLDRGDLRPGMAAPGTVLNNAFAAVGWYWGGRFHSPDYQHFSKTGG